MVLLRSLRSPLKIYIFLSSPRLYGLQSTVQNTEHRTEHNLLKCSLKLDRQPTKKKDLGIGSQLPLTRLLAVGARDTTRCTATATPTFHEFCWSPRSEPTLACIFLCGAIILVPSLPLLFSFVAKVVWGCWRRLCGLSFGPLLRVPFYGVLPRTNPDRQLILPLWYVALIV